MGQNNITLGGAAVSQPSPSFLQCLSSLLAFTLLRLASNLLFLLLLGSLALRRFLFGPQRQLHGLFLFPLLSFDSLLCLSLLFLHFEYAGVISIRAFSQRANASGFFEFPCLGLLCVLALDPPALISGFRLVWVVFLIKRELSPRLEIEPKVVKGLDFLEGRGVVSKVRHTRRRRPAGIQVKALAKASVKFTGAGCVFCLGVPGRQGIIKVVNRIVGCSLLVVGQDVVGLFDTLKAVFQFALRYQSIALVLRIEVVYRTRRVASLP
mmetsp:Transcript_29452/g.71668  ORF Transcript_29452/g.71668 Transcript_29452/m.71668 type:complete len:266 (-) Transcript_29452:184-981(-)